MAKKNRKNNKKKQQAGGKKPNAASTPRAAVDLDIITKEIKKSNEQVRANTQTAHAAIREVLVQAVLYRIDNNDQDDEKEVLWAAPDICNHQKDDDEEEEYVVYKVNNLSIPIKHIPQLSFSVSGVPLCHSLGASKMRRCRLYINQRLRTVRLVVNWVSASLIGLLQNFGNDTTLEELQDLKVSGRFAAYMMNLEEERRDDQEPSLLAGATFAIRQVKISKQVIDETLMYTNGLIDNARRDGILNDEYEVKVARANPGHMELGEASQEYMDLRIRSLELEMTRRLMLNVYARIPGALPEEEISFPLHEGCNLRDTSIANEEGKVKWNVMNSAAEESRIPLTSIAKLKIFMSNIPWAIYDRSLTQVQVAALGRSPFLFVHLNQDVTAVFAFNSSWSEMWDMLGPQGAVDFARRTVIASAALTPGNDSPKMLPNGKPNQLTMQFLALEIRLEAVQIRLDIVRNETATRTANGGDSQL